MLRAHFENVEQKLLADARIQMSAGHPLHKGTPREIFIRKFLQDHLSERVAIGTGEVIDAESRPGEPRHQIDIVLYRRDYPRLALGGDTTVFLAESVVATIEVKSKLDKEGLEQATIAARDTKQLRRRYGGGMFSGYHPPSILSYVVAYDGPASMRTVHGWVPEITASTGIQYPVLDKNEALRLSAPNPAVDGIFVLGRGFMHFGNMPFGFFRPAWLNESPDYKWAISNCTSGSLFLLFLFLTMAVSGSTTSWLDPSDYLRTFEVDDLAPG